MHVLACRHARAAVRIAYGRTILFLLMNDTNEVPEIAVMLNNLERVSFISLLISWTDIAGQRRLAFGKHRKPQEGHQEWAVTALSLDSHSHDRTYPSARRPREEHILGNMSPSRFRRNAIALMGLLIAMYCHCSRAFRCPAKIGFSAWTWV